jgi:hypothetical protein
MRWSDPSCGSLPRRSEKSEALPHEVVRVLEERAWPESGYSSNVAFGSAWKSAYELLVGTITSVLPFTTSTG